MASERTQAAPAQEGLHYRDRIRVLTITNWYPPHHFGGYELSCFDVMVRFERRGHEVHVLCGDTRLPGDPEPPDPQHEGRVRRQLRLYHDGSALLAPPWRERLAIERHNQRVLARAIAEVRPDVISVWHLAGASHGMLNAIAASGIPVVFAVCDDWLVYGLRLDRWAEPFSRTPLHRAAGRVVQRALGVPCVVADIGDLGPFLFVTRATEEAALTGSRWWPARRDVVWSGIDRTLYPALPLQERPWRWRIVTTGRFDPRKGFETAIRALPLLPPEATLALWGRGGAEERERLRGIAEALGVDGRVRFGSLEREELPAAYAAADAMVFPSEWAEPFGLVPVEAMACNTPVVATRVGGSAEFLHAEVSCLAFPPGDSEALAAALRRLGDDAGLRRRLVEAGRETAELLDVERLADIMEAWHVHEVEGPTGRPPSPRAGIPSRATPWVLRPSSAGHVTVGVGEPAPGTAIVHPAALPVRPGALSSATWRSARPSDAPTFDRLAAPEHLHRIVAELAAAVRPGGGIVVEGPNQRDLRRLRDAARAWWHGWSAPPPIRGAGLRMEDVRATLAALAESPTGATGGWSYAPAGRAAGAVLALLRIRGRGPWLRMEATVGERPARRRDAQHPLRSM